jgi:competence protein ComEC
MKDYRLFIPAICLIILINIPLSAEFKLKIVIVGLLISAVVYFFFVRHCVKRLLLVSSQLLLIFIVAMFGVFSLSIVEKQVNQVEQLDQVQLQGKITTDPKMQQSSFSSKCSFYMANPNVNGGLIKNNFLVSVSAVGETTPSPKVPPLQNEGEFNMKDETVATGECKYQYGETVAVTGKVKPNEKYTFLLFEATEVKVLEQPNPLDTVFNNLRLKFQENIGAVGIDGAEMIPAIAVGDDRLMEEEVDDASKVTGLTHILVVSGGHFVLIISILGILLGMLYLPRWTKVLFQIGAIFLLIQLVHNQDSIMRAATVCVIGITSVFFQRKSQSIAALSITVIGLVILFPNLAKSLGFLMSCTAMASIVILGPIISKKLENRIGKFCAELISIPLAAIVGVQPLLLLMNDFVPGYSLPANILVVPFVELVTVLGLLSCIFAFVPLIGSALAFITAIPNFFIYRIIMIFYKLPFAKLPFIGGIIGSLFWIVLIVVVVLLVKFGANKFGISKPGASKPGTGKPGANTTGANKFSKRDNSRILLTANRFLEQVKEAPKKSKVVLIISLSVTLVLATIYLGNFFINPPIKINQNWLTAECDVGQGDMQVINLGNNDAVVIDTGVEDKDSKKCIQELGVKKIELLILTHFHNDHIGGLKGVVDLVTPSKVWVANDVDEEEQSQSVFKLLDSRGIEYEHAVEMSSTTIGAIGNVLKLTVLTALELTGDSTANDSSIGVYIDYRNTKMVFTGDLELLGQGEMLQNAEQLQIHNIDILKVAHHGSKTQNDELLQLLKPRVAMIGVGKKNSYGHPNKTTLGKLTGLGATIVRTDENGLCGVILEEGKLKIYRSTAPSV